VELHVEPTGEVWKQERCPKCGGAADAEMLVCDGGILDGHLPAAELDELAARALVRGEERGAFEHGDNTGRATSPATRAESKADASAVNQTV
jgi:hypothetical protein